MGQEMEDRRTRRTRQSLQDALLALLKKKRYEDISVQEIIERADVARSTFYMHYTDKDDLLVGRHGIFAGNLAQHAGLMTHDEMHSSAALPTRGWFYHIQAQRDILKIIAKDPAMDLAMKTLYELIHRYVQERIQHELSVENNSIPASALVDYLTGSLMALMKWWVKEGMVFSPEQMDEMFQKLAMPGVGTALKTGVHNE